MSKKKVLAALLFAMFLMLALVACGGDDKPAGTSKASGSNSSRSGSQGNDGSSSKPPAVFENGHVTITASGDLNTGVILTAVYDQEDDFPALSYQWEMDGAKIDGQTSKTITTTAEGDYFVQVTTTGSTEVLGPSVSTRVINAGSVGIAGTATITATDGGALEVGKTLQANYVPPTSGPGDASGATTYTYTWFKGVGATPAGNGATLDTTTLGAGIYYVLIKADGFIGIVRSIGYDVEPAGGAAVAQKILEILVPATAITAANSLTFTSDMYSGGKDFTLSRDGSNNITISTATSGVGARYYSAGWTKTGDPSGSYWQIATFAGNFSQLTLDLSMGGTAQAPRDFRVQYSYNGTTFTDIQNSPTFNLGATANNTLQIQKTIPNGSGTLVIRLLQDSIYAINGTSGDINVSSGNQYIKTVVLNGVYTP